MKRGDGNRLRPGPQANPAGDTGQCEPDKLTGSAVAETIRASGHKRRVKQAGHMTARNNKLSPISPLPHWGRPHMSPELKWGFDVNAGVGGTIGGYSATTGEWIGPDADEAGGYYSYGEGYGLYASAGFFFGHYDGTIADLATPTDNISVGILVFGGTLMFEKGTWDYAGFTIDVGPGLGAEYVHSSTSSSVWSSCNAPCRPKYDPYK